MSRAGVKRHNAKRDANEKDIKAALTAVGALWWQLDEPCDLLVFFRNVFYVIEVKVPGGRLQPSQVTFFEAVGNDAPAGVAWHADDALRIIGAIDGVTP